MRVVLRLKITKEVGGANVGCVKVKVGCVKVKVGGVKVKVGGVKVKVGGVELLWKVLWLLLMTTKSCWWQQRAIGNRTGLGAVLMASESMMGK